MGERVTRRNLGTRRLLTGLTALLLTVTACSGDGQPLGPADVPGLGGPSVSDPPRGGESGPPEPPALPASLTEQQLDWDACPAPTTRQGGGAAPGALPDGTEWECSELTVPLDYGAPEGETLGLALIRATASGPAGERIGSLVFNFGGPGGSGVTSLPRLSERYATLRDGFDLVSFDPRGVGESEAVVCLADAEIDADGQHRVRSPRTAEEERDYLRRAKEYAAACRERAGDLLPYLRTEDAARDLDVLRHALGDDQLHYFGSSYGTKLGGVYAALFPERVGRTVFDAVVDPSRDVVQRALGQTAGFQVALDNYLADCVRQGDCPAGDSPQEGNEIITALLQGLANDPLPTTDGRQLTQGLAFSGLFSLLYSETAWPYLSRALTEALADDSGDLLLAAADQYNGRDAEGHYHNLHAANSAINCADFASRPGLDTVHEYRDEFTEVSSVFGPFLLWGLLGCAGWPVLAERDQPEVHAEGARPILLIGTTGDPATPYEGAERMRDALGEGVGVLLTYDGEGHGAYTGRNGCVTEAVNAHLLSGKAPRSGLVCG